MQLAATRIITGEVDALVTFYEKATGIAAERIHPMFAELRTPSGTLAFADVATMPLLGVDAAEAGADRSVIVDFLVDDVDATYRALQDVVEVFVREPTDMPWGNRSLLVRDPDGHLINFFTPVSEAAAARFADEARDQNTVDHTLKRNSTTSPSAMT
ncbi:VOC family protein [Nocardia cyriacigeorgica]|nr:VOC family protein [Nocardia cyriacigeorgica]